MEIRTFTSSFICPPPHSNARRRGEAHTDDRCLQFVTPDSSQKYKEGKVILEKVRLFFQLSSTRPSRRCWGGNASPPPPSLRFPERCVLTCLREQNKIYKVCLPLLSDYSDSALTTDRANRRTNGRSTTEGDRGRMRLSEVDEAGQISYNRCVLSVYSRRITCSHASAASRAETTVYRPRESTCAAQSRGDATTVSSQRRETRLLLFYSALNTFRPASRTSSGTSIPVQTFACSAREGKESRLGASAQRSGEERKRETYRSTPPERPRRRRSSSSLGPRRCCA